MFRTPTTLGLLWFLFSYRLDDLLREREREKKKGLSHVLHVRGSGKIVLLYHVISLRKVLDFSQQEFHYINILLNRPLQLGMCCGSFLSLV